MKTIPFSLVVALLMVGCGTSEPNLEDPETRNKIAADAIDSSGVGFKLPEKYTGWNKQIRDDGSFHSLSHYKEGKPDGLSVGWFKNGKMREKVKFLAGKIVFLEVFKPNGEKCPDTKIDENGNGVWHIYVDSGRMGFLNIKDSELVED